MSGIEIPPDDASTLDSLVGPMLDDVLWPVKGIIEKAYRIGVACERRRQGVATHAEPSVCETREMGNAERKAGADSAAPSAEGARRGEAKGQAQTSSGGEPGPGERADQEPLQGLQHVTEGLDALRRLVTFGASTTDRPSEAPRRAVLRSDPYYGLLTNAPMYRVHLQCGHFFDHDMELTGGTHPCSACPRPNEARTPDYATCDACPGRRFPPDAERCPGCGDQHKLAYGYLRPDKAQPIKSELFPLAVRIEKGRQKYPNGCTVLSLIDEAGEVAHAVNKYEPAERIREELLDVAAVAMRLYFGEIDRGLEIDGLEQKRIADKVRTETPTSEKGTENR